MRFAFLDSALPNFGLQRIKPIASDARSVWRSAGPWIGAAALAVFVSSAWAERADRDAQMVAEADAVRHDELKQTTQFKGNVLISKGTIRIRAALVDFKYDQEGYQQAIASADAGKRVFFRQKREGLDEFIEAESEKMEYSQRADTLQFTGSAILRRFRGATLQDEVTGQSIFYDNKTESFSVDKLQPGAASAPAASSAAGRVRVVLSARSAASAPASSPAPSASGARPALQPSSSVGSIR